MPSTRQRTIIVISSYAPSLWNFRAELIGKLLCKGYRVLTCAPACAGAREKVGSLGASFIAVGPRRASLNPIGDIRYFSQLLRLFLQVRPVAIIAYTAKPVIWGSIAGWVTRTPRIIAIITGLGFAFTGQDGQRWLVSRLVQRLYRAAMYRCDCVVFQNMDDQCEFSRRGLTRRGSKSFVVNGSGVNLQRFAPSELPSQPVFLLIARLLRDKGINEFCEAAGRVRSRFPESRFRIVGWFDDNLSAIRADELTDWCANGLVEYRGAVEDVRPEIAAARVYVLPSYREGTPRTVLEAMAMGRPIITTDVPGCRETVRDGWNGYLVPPRNVGALETAMEKFLLQPDLALTMGANSRALAETKYDARSVAELLLLGSGL
jgi:glycosyltransferase involved in cell wall biosynthesis